MIQIWNGIVDEFTKTPKLPWQLLRNANLTPENTWIDGQFFNWTYDDSSIIDIEYISKWLIPDPISRKFTYNYFNIDNSNNPIFPILDNLILNKKDINIYGFNIFPFLSDISGIHSYLKDNNNYYIFYVIEENKYYKIIKWNTSCKLIECNTSPCNILLEKISIDKILYSFITDEFTYNDAVIKNLHSSNNWYNKTRDVFFWREYYNYLSTPTILWKENSLITPSLRVEDKSQHFQLVPILISNINKSKK